MGVCVSKYTIVPLQFKYLAEYGELLESVDKSQLTHELGGYLEYVHEDWVRFRMVSTHQLSIFLVSRILWGKCN